MNRTYLLIGGNLGNRIENMEKARKLIADKIGEILAISPLYETEAWGKTDQPPFLNQVILSKTFLSPEQLLNKILDIEQMMGRQRNEKFGPRTIDVDILFFNDLIINKPGLTIPHPQLQLRRFALEPLQAIAGNYIHPVFRKTIAQLLKECPDPLAVKKL